MKSTIITLLVAALIFYSGWTAHSFKCKVNTIIVQDSTRIEYLEDQIALLQNKFYNK